MRYGPSKCHSVIPTILSKMPTVRVETNLGFEFFPEQFMPLFVLFIAEIFSKDKNLMKWTFDTDKRMSMVSSI